EEQRDVAGGGMVVENRRDQADRKHQARNYSPAQLEPHGEKGDLLAEPLSLPIAPVQIIRDDREERTEHKLKHGPAPFAASGRSRAGGRRRRRRPLAWLRPPAEPLTLPPLVSPPRPSHRAAGPSNLRPVLIQPASRSIRQCG